MTKRAALIVMDCVIWGLVIYLVLMPNDPLLRARACWHTTRCCWAIAAWFGRLAIQAELRYNREMEASR